MRYRFVFPFLLLMLIFATTTPLHLEGEGSVASQNANDPIGWAIPTNLSTTQAPSEGADIAVLGRSVYIVWQEGSPSEVYFRKSTDGGWTWHEKKNISQTPGTSQQPSITADSNAIYVVWSENVEEDYDVYFSKSFDGGDNWSDPKAIAITAEESAGPVVAVDNEGGVHVLWEELSTSTNKYTISHSRSFDGGENWSSPFKISTSDLLDCLRPSLTVDGKGYLHAVWDVEDRYGLYVHYKRSTDGGESWPHPSEEEEDISKDIGGGSASHPDITADGGDNIYVVWNTCEICGSENNYVVHYRKSEDSGDGWLIPGNSALANTYQPDPIYHFPLPKVVTNSKGDVFVFWQDGFEKGGNYAIFYSFSNDGGASWSSPSVVVGSSDADAERVAVAVDSDDNIHIAWQQRVSGEWDVFYSRTLPFSIFLPIAFKNFP